MRLAFVLGILALCGCAPPPCPPYSGFVEGREWRFSTAETDEVREIESISADGVVVLRAILAGAGFESSLRQTLRCEEDGVRLLESEIDQNGVEVFTYPDPPLLLTADPRPGDRIGGVTIVAESSTAGEVEQEFALLEVQEHPPLSTPLGELEVLAYLLVDEDGVPIPEIGVLRHRELGLVDLLGAGELVSITPEPDL